MRGLEKEEREFEEEIAMLQRGLEAKKSMTTELKKQTLSRSFLFYLGSR